MKKKPVWFWDRGSCVGIWRATSSPPIAGMVITLDASKYRVEVIKEYKADLIADVRRLPYFPL